MRRCSEETRTSPYRLASSPGPIASQHPPRCTDLAALLVVPGSQYPARFTRSVGPAPPQLHAELILLALRYRCGSSEVVHCASTVGGFPAEARAVLGRQ